MKKIMVLTVSLLMFLSFGCASRDYVRQQMEPLVDRISKLESKEDCCARAEQAAKKCEKSFELQQKGLK